MFKRLKARFTRTRRPYQPVTSGGYGLAVGVPGARGVEIADGALLTRSPELAALVQAACDLTGTLRPAPALPDDQAIDGFAGGISDALKIVEFELITQGNCLLVARPEQHGALCWLARASEWRRGDSGEVIVDDKPIYTQHLIATRGATAETPDGRPDILPALPVARDLLQLNDLVMQSAMLAAQQAIIETKQIDASPLSSIFADGGEVPPQPLRINGTQVVSLSPGHNLQTLNDQRPAQNLQSHMRTLRDSMALSVGLPACMVYDVDGTTADARMSLQRLRLWRLSRIAELKRVAEFLEFCLRARCEARGQSVPESVQWVPTPDPSIDIARDGQLVADLAPLGLADADAYALAATGRTRQELIDGYNTVKTNDLTQNSIQ